jgi:hypothetical protein
MAESKKDLQGFTQEQMDKMFDFWTDVLKLPTIGPMYAFSKDVSSYASDFANLGKMMAGLKTNMDGYWALISTAYAKAMKETMERVPKQLVTKDDFENYRRAAIEAFEDAFTGLFASAEFSAVYGKMFSSQLDVSKAIQSIAEKNFKTLNLPTRSELDDILKDVAELKRSVRDLKRSMEIKR